MQLRNKYNKETLKKKLAREDFSRITLSFYKYVILENVESFRDDLYKKFSELNVLGRIYLAHEGVNAQVSVPEPDFEKFRSLVDSIPEFTNVPFKIAVEDGSKSFLKLIVRLRNKIVADGLKDGSFDVTNVGKHLSAREWNEAMATPQTVVVDMRNHYESEVGHFENAILPSADTFKEELPMVVEQLKGKEDKKILMYCTGGIRCEKASAWLKHNGFTNVSQLYGGIIEYARQVKQSGLPSKFRGKNFVFDERMGERITDEVIAHCHQCGASCDRQVNCANSDCHVLFIQCESCAAKHDACCSDECKAWIKLPEEERAKLRAEGKGVTTTGHYSKRLRPVVGKKD